MFTKTIPLVAALSSVLLLTASSARAQQVTPVGTRQQAAPTLSSSDFDLLRKDLRAQKKQIIATNLPLTPDEATKFWPVYEEYTAETIKVNDKRYALVAEYAQAYNTMTNEQASSYIKRWLAVDEEAAKLRSKYIPIVEKVLPEKKAAMFFQLDRRLSMMLELQLSSQLPLVEP